MLNHDILGVVERQVRTWSADDAEVYAAATGGYSPAFAIPLLQHGGPQLGLTGADMTQVLHAEQSLWLHGRLPRSGSTIVTKTVTGIHDKGSGAIVVSTWESEYASTRSSCFLKGEGGFGGDRGETREFAVPATRPETSFFQTTTDQALRYSETGDMNPMHHDDGLARSAGYPEAFSVGMLTAGYLASACTDAYGTETVRRFGVRFRDLVWRGDVLTAAGTVRREYVEDGEQRVELDLTMSTERGAVPLHGVAEFAIT